MQMKQPSATTICCLGVVLSCRIAVAIVNNAGDLNQQTVIRSTVGRFLQEVDCRNLLPDRRMLLVGKFLRVGQARKDSRVPRPPPPPAHP
jgi:hypothetical protein